MKITIRKSEHLPDWYLIVRAEHDNKTWVEVIDYIHYHMKSERLSPEACIEGDSSEMIDIAKAIKSRTSASAKRVAVSFEDDGVHLYSPKNSQHHGIVTIEEADDLADQILAEFIKENKE